MFKALWKEEHGEKQKPEIQLELDRVRTYKSLNFTGFLFQPKCGIKALNRMT